MALISRLDAGIQALEAEKIAIGRRRDAEIAAINARLDLLRRARLKIDDELDKIYGELVAAKLVPEVKP